MNEVLQVTHPFPINRSFVIKLHRDADLGAGELQGRIVHLVSDERVDFVGATELLQMLRSLISKSADHPVEVSKWPRKGH